MEKINKEIIISSLFSMGFDKVDALLGQETFSKTKCNMCNQLYNFIYCRTVDFFNKNFCEFEKYSILC